MENASGSFSKRRRRAAIAIAACGIAAAGGVHAKPAYSTVVVPPADLPEPARHGGEAMFLRDTRDGRTILYVKQNQGSRLAAFDVTDPAHVKSDDSLPVQAAGRQEVDDLNVQVRKEITRVDTGTTFVLSEDGLYVIRRPAVEMIHQLMAIPPN